MFQIGEDPTLLNPKSNGKYKGKFYHQQEYHNILSYLFFDTNTVILQAPSKK
jgi:hypothetical protein